MPCVFSHSSRLREHLRILLVTWRPNPERLVFATRNGTPWDANLLVKRKLRPLLRDLKIRECGLHAFRHANASLMDEYSAFAAKEWFRLNVRKRDQPTEDMAARAKSHRLAVLPIAILTDAFCIKAVRGPRGISGGSFSTIDSESPSSSTSAALRSASVSLVLVTEPSAATRILFVRRL